MKSLYTLIAVTASLVVLAGCTTTNPSPTTPQADAAGQEQLAYANYKLYDKSTADAAIAEGKKVAVFFHSKTCGSCAKLNADIEANAANIPNDVLILKTDWDTYQDLAKEYNVDKYHTVTYLTTAGPQKNIKGLFTLNDVLAELS